jgi:hypothetical protein
MVFLGIWVRFPCDFPDNREISSDKFAVDCVTTAMQPGLCPVSQWGRDKDTGIPQLPSDSGA